MAGPLETGEQWDNRVLPGPEDAIGHPECVGTQNIAGEKRVRQDGVDFDYLFSAKISRALGGVRFSG